MFESLLKQQDSATWARAIQALLPSIHEVDRDATRVWFHFFPLALAEAFARAGDPARLSRQLQINGTCLLASQCDTSHWFFYGHRHWPAVKAAIIARAESAAPSSSVDLASIIRELASETASRAAVAEPLLVGIAAVGLMTLQQVGIATFRLGSAVVPPPRAIAARSPAQIVAARAKDDSQGLFGFLRGLKSQYSVRFDEGRDDARFALIRGQHLTTAAAGDNRDYSTGSRFCVEGPIPVQCRSASCGTCWVGILGGAQKLSDVDALEARRMAEFGYITSKESKPFIRLSCMAVASGNVTLVIPPWNGFLGRAGLGHVEAPV